MRWRILSNSKDNPTKLLDRHGMQGKEALRWSPIREGLKGYTVDTGPYPKLGVPFHVRTTHPCMPCPPRAATHSQLQGNLPTCLEIKAGAKCGFFRQSESEPQHCGRRREGTNMGMGSLRLCSQRLCNSRRCRSICIAGVVCNETVLVQNGSSY